LEDFKSGKLEFPIVEDFLTDLDLKKEFRNRNRESSRTEESRAGE